MPIILRIDGTRIVVNLGDHLPTHVHVQNKDKSLEVKIDISGDTAEAMRPAKDERIKTTPAFTKLASKLCQDNLQFLQNAVRIYYEAE